MTQKEKRTAANLAAIQDAVLFETGDNETSLYVKPNGNGYDWIMISPKTGSHIVKQKNLKLELSERVKNHWKVFQENQKN